MGARLALVSGLVAGIAAPAYAGSGFTPGDLVVSRSTYDNNPNNVVVGQVLPPGCALTSVGCGTPPVTATNNGTYPEVFNNALADGSFSITSKIYLDEITPSGSLVTSLQVPNSSQNGVPPTKDQMVTSFSSKSELALNLSSDRNYLTFMGYFAPIDAIDVSNSNTPAWSIRPIRLGRIIIARLPKSTPEASSALLPPTPTVATMAVPQS